MLTHLYSTELLTLMEVSFEGDVPGGGRKGQGAKSPLCSGCFPGSVKRGPTWSGGGGEGLAGEREERGSRGEEKKSGGREERGREEEVKRR